MEFTSSDLNAPDNSDRAIRKHVESGSNMLKRNAHKNLKISSTDSLTIDDVDEMIYMNTASLENIEGHEQAEQTQPTNDAPTSNVYPKAPTPAKNKKSKHDHLEGMTDILRGGMDNLASAISRLSSMPPIPENEI
ncbi:hypothetical protein HAX54_045745 [Datura stramonium]|uniref:Uncharacterized protein n=1 Tax=Datura stramonium TaxID=4076 RepID=A0ABS8SSA2_DATST|nr:hypothetical protein [Datura stramonium]